MPRDSSKSPRSGRGRKPRNKPSRDVFANPLIRLLIVDDHAVVRGGLEAMLSLDPTIERILTATSGAEALEISPTFDPHVVLLDLRMPGMDGHSVLESFSHRWPHIRVIVLTGNDSPAAAKLAKRQGAAGFISKSANPSILPRIIARVVAGGSHFPELDAPSDAEDCGLSARELEVLQHLARGLTNDEIGRVLGVSGQTVKGHLKNIFPKLQAANRAEAATRAHELNLV
jgi:DNA-binding NarL/FixJ family response regulator